MKFKNLLKGAALIAALFSTTLVSAADHNKATEQSIKVGVVDFRTCIEKSYLGQSEQNRLETMQNDMISSMEEKQTQLQVVVDKLKNQDYMDTLNASAEQELQAQFKELSDQMQMAQYQANQSWEKARMDLFQTMNSEVAKAAEYLAREEGLDLILNQESVFFFKRPSDITPLVVAELNRHYDKDTLEATAPRGK